MSSYGHVKVICGQLPQFKCDLCDQRTYIKIIINFIYCVFITLSHLVKLVLIIDSLWVLFSVKIIKYDYL